MRFQKSAIFDHFQPVISSQVVLSFSDKKAAKKFRDPEGPGKKFKKIFSKIFSSINYFTCAAGRGRS